ncbi:MAG TPA: hypothetical protein VJ987_03170, partial [Anaerolineales bacterium]|nr:hypothetical protein [Anaerolineales bacterium]
MFKRTNSFVLFTLVLVLALSACGTPTSSSNGQPAAPVLGGENGGEGGVEAALVTYSDSTQGFAIGHPGPWTQDATFT